MASSASGGLDSSEAEARRTYFWCHQCNARTTNTPGSEEFTCGSCGSGFVEEITEEAEPAADDDDDYWDDDDFGMADDQAHQMGLDPIFQQFFSAAVGSSQPRAGGGRAGPTWTARRRRVRGQGPQVVMGTGDQFLQMLLSNLTGVQFAAGGGGGGGFVPVMPLYGNPGDYAWGRGGLDAVVTTLLNQIDGAGPAPMQTDSISQIPKIKISSSQVEAKLQCSVCWDDFALDEEVRKLVCEHIFHDGCIVPWLQLHATCPVCRKTQQPEEQEARTGFTDGTPPSAADILSPLFVGASSGAHSGGASSMTATAGGSSSSRGPSTAAAPEAASSLGNTISTVFNQFFGIPSPSSPSTSSSPPTSTASSSSSSASTSSGGGGPSPTSSNSQSNSTNRRNTSNNPPKNDSFKDMDLE